jgi:hypothetical protein
MFSSCNVSGLFSLIRANRDEAADAFRTPGNQWTTNNVGSFFTYYDTAILCTDGTCITAKLRVPCKSPTAERADNSIAFVVGTVFVKSLSDGAYIDAKHVRFIADGEDADVSPVPSFFNTHMDCLGSVCGDAYVLGNGAIAFPVALSVYILNDIKTFRLM